MLGLGGLGLGTAKLAKDHLGRRTASYYTEYGVLTLVADDVRGNQISRKELARKIKERRDRKEFWPYNIEVDAASYERLVRDLS